MSLSDLNHKSWKNVAYEVTNIYYEEGGMMEFYFQGFVVQDFKSILKLSIVVRNLSSDLSGSSSKFSVGEFYFVYRCIYFIEIISYKFS